MALALFYIFIYNPKTEYLKYQLKSMKVLNKHIQKQNDSLLTSIKKIEADIVKTDEIITSLFEENYLLQQNVDSLNSKLHKTKERYEKARIHANNFNSNELQRYFADLQ